MAIATNDSIDKFGTLDEVTIASPSSVVSGAFSAAADTTDWTNDEDVNGAVAIFVGDFTVAPAANSTIDLYIQEVNVISTKDSIEPSTTFKHVYLCSFPLNNSTGEQLITAEIYLANVKTSASYHFYIQNSSDQTLDATTWELHIQPRTIGPKV